MDTSSVGGPDLRARVAEHARSSGLFPAPGLALLAVSGGPDSVALLDLMHVAASELGLSLVVGHVDHGIAPESTGVAQDVARLAARYDVPAHTSRLALGFDASETEARRARYQALRAVQRRLGARYLVTAHHADDQAETVLYRLLRGSGPAGLAGIPSHGPDGLVRPLLPFRKTELQAWLDTRGAEVPLPIHEDPANADERHDRSWVRVRLLPLLRERFGPDLDQGLLESARQAAEHRVAWAALLGMLPELQFSAVGGRVEVARSPFRRYDKALSFVLLRALGREVGCRIGRKTAARLLQFAVAGSSGRVLELGAGWEAELAFERLRIARAPRAGDARAGRASWDDAAGGHVQWGSWEFRWRPEPAGAVARDTLTTWITPGGGEIRALRAGDRIFPLGGVGRRKVRRLLMEARVPRREREAYPVVVRRHEVLWIPGVCRAGSCLPGLGERAIRLEARATERPEGR